jgi:hypothetical protein
VIVTRLFKKFIKLLREGCQLLDMTAFALFVSTVTLHFRHIHTYNEARGGAVG